MKNLKYIRNPDDALSSKNSVFVENWTTHPELWSGKARPLKKKRTFQRNFSAIFGSRFSAIVNYHRCVRQPKEDDRKKEEDKRRKILFNNLSCVFFPVDIGLICTLQLLLQLSTGSSCTCGALCVCMPPVDNFLLLPSKQGSKKYAHSFA